MHLTKIAICFNSIDLLRLGYNIISVCLFCLCRGYLAPEYALVGQLTKKADVYSFGILMLEIISGKSSSKAAFGDNILVLVEWVYFWILFFLIKIFLDSSV